MLNIYKISIRNKIIIIILTISISSLLISFSTVFINVVNESERSLIINAKLHAKLIAEYSVTPIDFNDKKGALEILSKSEEVPEIVFSRIYDSNNTIFAEFGNNLNLDKIDIVGQGEEFIIEDDFIHIYQPIIYKNGYLGTVYLLITKKYFKADRLSYLIRFMILFTVVLVLVVFFSVILQKYISKPILELAYKINQTALSGDYTKKIVGKYNDEIGELYKGYNNFLDQISKRELEKQIAQKEVLESEQHLSSIFNAAKNVSFIVTDLNKKDSIIKDFSPGAEEIFGYSKKEILGNKVSLLHKGDDMNLPGIQKKLENGETAEVVFIRKNKIEFPALLTLFPWHNYKGEVMGTLCVSVDITDLKKIENELKKHREHLEELIEERTKELAEKNKELQDKNVELEKYNELFIGREFRIKELKDKVKELEEKK